LDQNQSSQAPASQPDKPEFGVHAPAISLPKGGGAIRGIGEKFSANPVTGTGTLTVPIFTSPGRSGFGPQLSLSYDSGAGNGPFGLGWRLALPSITRKTDKGLPRYFDAEESDVFILSGAEDLVPVLRNDAGKWEREDFDSPASEPGYSIRRYRPRIEGLFARIERWTEKATRLTHWRSVSKDNVTTLYGKSGDSRIADPTDASRVYEWLICQTYDDRGNALVYEYKAEDAVNVDTAAPQEKNRLIAPGFAQRYLKRVRYGNRTPNRDAQWRATDASQLADWMFELVLDYGEHDQDRPTTAEVRPWPVRADAFSRYRATFEVRQYRLCRRALMFHHFASELGAADCLVRSTDFDYAEAPIASFVKAITQSGYRRQADGSYFKKSMPRLEFRYSKARVDPTVHEIDAGSVENLPVGIDGTQYQWVDLDSEGVSGVLAEQADAWYYKRNQGNGTFGAVERVYSYPSITALSAGPPHLADINGDGLLEIVHYGSPVSGFQERTSEGKWREFKPFRSAPNVAWKDPNLRFIDLTGDGFADILISENAVFTWYPSRSTEGFGPAERTCQSWDEEEGPKLVFADPTQSIFLADMAGGGLTDIVRIRNGEICYWPNLGYGRFGAKVTMGHAPVFDRDNQFDPQRIRLADIDGSGSIDIIYLATDEIRLYFNQAGNSWSDPERLTHFPRVDNLTSITTVDLLGNGTACLVWSSPLGADSRAPMRYIDLMGGQKPHLLIFSTNNMGAETEVTYVASTKFYLEDRAAGIPWVTRLAFPVHVIARTENRDLVSKSRLVSTYRYRHGYFDGAEQEREFRGFAYVEQRDAETVVGEFQVPPTVTKSWFHTGAFLESQKLEAWFKDPARGEYFTGDPQAVLLPDTQWPTESLSADELREACRALKGSLLRQEVYADDGSPKALLPYSVSERSYRVRVIQPRGPNLHASFLTHADQTLAYHYERQIEDPRVGHEVALEVDEFGVVTKSASVAYGRRQADPTLKPEDQAKQSQQFITYRETAVIHKAAEADWYRVGLPAETRTYEVTGLKAAGAAFTPDELMAATAASEIPYERLPDGSVQKRSIEVMRSLYRRNNLNGLLPLGQVESMALPGEQYKLAFTPGLLDVYQSKAARGALTSLLTGPEGRYRDLDGDGRLWLPSGQVYYSPKTPPDPPDLELAFAREHFFLGHRFQDPFGNVSVATYDDPHRLLVIYTRDAAGNEVKADCDYRILLPRRLVDPNGNRSEARFDALGMLAGTAIMGKATGAVEGDSFDQFTDDLTPQQVTDFFNAANPRSLAVQHLGTATTRIIYDLEQMPVCAAAIARETHVNDLAIGSDTAVHIKFVYSDGFGREAQSKVPAEPGPLDLSDPASPQADPRWTATGTKVYSNKGSPVRQFEPFFAATPQFGVEQYGVSSTLFHDPLERVVATLHPNHTFEKTVFDAWHQVTFDVNDTVTFDPKADPDVGSFLRALPDADYLPTWYQRRSGGGLGSDEKAAAIEAAAHANTPTASHVDALGRVFLTVVDNGVDTNGQGQKIPTRVELTIEGHQRSVKDALNRIVMNYDYDMAGNKIHQSSMEAGERWMLGNAAGKPIRSWNSRGFAFRVLYDGLLRPVSSYVSGNGMAELLVEKTLYGEAQGSAQNHRGRVHQHFDSAGVATNVAFDFKGNLLKSTRQLVQVYKQAPDWSSNPAPALEAEVYAAATRFDALNRPIQVIPPHQDQAAANISVIRPGYNEALLLERVDVWLGQNAEPASLLDPTAATLHAVVDIDYDAKGQRTLIQYGNGTTTDYGYDADTFRLVRMASAGKPGGQGIMARLVGFVFPAGTSTFQDLHYTYDPAGNITRIRDDAQQAAYFNNQVVSPVNDYRYDPSYRLIEATGREHIGQQAQPQTSWDDGFRVNLPQPGDGQALRQYTEKYQYDDVGNFEQLIHQAANGNWTRTYHYGEASLIEPGKVSNRLTSTTVAGVTDSYPYDAHGNMVGMPHLTRMDWDYRDQLSATARQVVNASPPPALVPETTYFVYDAAGERIRKVTERQNGTRKEERLYFGGFEVYRSYKANGTAVQLERDTLHVMDDKRRIALVETRVQGSDGSPKLLIRFQLGNHLGSASVELDDKSNVISYEEYYPYGSTSYQAVDKGLKAAAKRYRYTGKERDEETGLNYHSARYYAPWVGRWVSCDPGGLEDEDNLFLACRNNPITFTDENGRESVGQLIEEKALSAAKEERHVSLYFWALLDVTWSAFGAEGVSRVVDDPHKASTGDYVRAGIEVISVIPVGKVAKAGKALIIAKEAAPTIVKEAAPIIAKEAAPIVAKEVAPVAAKEIAPTVAKEAAPTVAKEAAPTVAKEVAPTIAKEAAPAAGKAAAKGVVEQEVKTGLGLFKKAEKYGIKPYKELKNLIKGKGLEAHHLIEKRFAKLLGVDAAKMESLALTKAEHQAFTRAWRKAIGYVGDKAAVTTANVTKEQVLNAAKSIYRNHPEILKALGL
jgi:RHS repeat-associated protein